MNANDDVRRSVSDFYTRAVKAGAGCCGPSPGCCGGPAVQGVVPGGCPPRFAGYGQHTAGLPADAIENSFGCGNPLAFAEVLPGQVVLDLGSGAGLDLLLAARMVGPTGRVIGVDMTPEMIARARANAARAGFTNIEVREGFIEDLPVDSGSVDWVISNCVINLSPEKNRVFAEIARVLRPGGRMSVWDIVAQDLPDRVRRSIILYASCVAGAVSEDEYAEGLRRAGLVDVRVAERHPYGMEQLRALSDVQPDGWRDCCVPLGESGRCGGDTVDLGALAAEVAGKVWSARFEARKPDSTRTTS